MKFCCWLVLAWWVSDYAFAALEDYFGSKSPYPFPPPVCSSNSTQNHTALFMLVRHGSRFPTKKHLLKYESLKPYQSFLGNWTHRFRLRNEGLLSPTGIEEMKRIGAHVRQLYPSLFADRYHPRSHEFRSSKVLRTLQSASAFSMGLFGENQPVSIESESLENDHLLRFHENCAQYQKEKKRHTPQMDHVWLPVLDKLEKRLGIALSKKEVEALWSACVFEGSLVGPSGGACSFFDEEDGERLEYVLDVQDYWEKGFGRRLNFQMACPLVNDMLHSLQEGKTRFLFGHAENVLPLMTGLGFFEEHPDLYSPKCQAETWKTRKYKSGLVAPFASNLAVSLDTQNEVEIRHNGVLLDFSHLCTRPCPLEKFVIAVKQRMGVEGCDFKALCQLE